MKRMIYNFFLLAGILVAGTAYAQVQRDTVANYPLDRKVDITMTTSLIRTVSGEKLEEMPAGDIRSRMTGQLPGFFATEENGQYWGGSNSYSGVFP